MYHPFEPLVAIMESRYICTDKVSTMYCSRAVSQFTCDDYVLVVSL